MNIWKVYLRVNGQLDTIYVDGVDTDFELLARVVKQYQTASIIKAVRV